MANYRSCNQIHFINQTITFAAISDNFTIAYSRDAALAPLGGPIPTPGDNNTLNYSVMWNDGTKDHQFGSQFTARNISYSDVNTTATDSGSGLAPPGISDPPGVCS